MDRLVFEKCLVQTLENYGRCGVNRFSPTAANEAIGRLLSERFASEANSEQTSKQRSARTPAQTSTQTSAFKPEFPRCAEGEPEGGRRGLDTEAVAHSAGSRGEPSTATAAVSSIENAGQWSGPRLEVVDRESQLAELDSQVRQCRRCQDIVCFRQQTVFGSGTMTPRICFLGEAPGADEDRTGQPFVGKAGQLLTKIIEAMKLRREDVYILNGLKCRPPQNRTPVPDEIDNCRPYVETQLEVLQPEFIVCLGAVAVRSLLQSNLSIGRLRGKFHTYRGARVVVTYHPSYLLRQESAKKMVWEDMQMLMHELTKG